MGKAAKALAQVAILEDRLRREQDRYALVTESLEECLAEESAPVSTGISVFRRVCITIRAQRDIIHRQREQLLRLREKLNVHTGREMNAWRWPLRRDAEAGDELRKIMADMPEKRYFGVETVLQIALRAVKRLHTTIEIAKPFLAEDRERMTALKDREQAMLEVLSDSLVGQPEFNFTDRPVYDNAASCIERLLAENGELRVRVALLRSVHRTFPTYVCADCGGHREVEEQTPTSRKYKRCAKCGCFAIRELRQA
jgi:hypothetical protein